MSSEGASSHPLYTHPRFARICKPSHVHVTYINGAVATTVTPQSREVVDLPPSFERVDWLPPKFNCIQQAVEPTIATDASVVGIDAASMACVWALNLDRSDSVLDLCAAPGGKAMAISEFVDKVVCVDLAHSRLNVMRSLMDKLGYKNVLVLEADARSFKSNDQGTYKVHIRRARGRRRKIEQPQLPPSFTKVLVDVECTHDGSAKHLNKGTLSAMSDERIAQLPQLQYEILANGWAHLDKTAPTARLIYSTCSFSPSQNEKVIERFLAEEPQAAIGELPFSPDNSPCVAVGNVGVLFGRLPGEPLNSRTGGLFISCLKLREVQ